eukprot:Clim_evm64s243 gene=Clim_evmTU64s243
MTGTVKIVSPVDGSVFVERPLASKDEALKAISKAEEAQREWRKVPVAERCGIMTKFIDHFVSLKDELAMELTMQMGRPVGQAGGEIGGTEERARYMTKIAPECLKDVEVGKVEGFTRFVRKDPIGVCLIAGAWNYPYLITINATVPAILAGNTVILKQSSQTLLAAERFAASFKAAGLPDGVFQYLHMDHDVTATVIQDPRVGFVNFTGSVKGGHEVVKAASDKFMAIGLELGGKDPAYVRADADLSYSVAELVSGAFFNCGQCCCAIERIYVHEDVYDTFVSEYVEETKKMILGDPREAGTTLGPCVRVSAADWIRKQIADAVAAGAQTHIDASLFPLAADEKGPYLAPQVLTNVDHSMSVMRDESFGPVIGIMKVSGDEEAIRLMNDSEFGLTASVWTKDYETGLAIGDQVQTGTFFVNRCDYLDPALAWTGVKDSGRGVSLSQFGFDSVTQPKSFHCKQLS